MGKKKKTLVLIDGNALIHRAYHALPPLTTKQGEVVNAVYGFTLTLLSVLERFKPDYIAASFDLPGPTFRDALYAEYKAKRVQGPDDLYAQIPRVKEVTRAFNVPIYEQAGFEADDCVGTLARQAEQAGIETVIVTGDNDALQLVTPCTRVFMLRRSIKDTALYDEQAVERKYGIASGQLPDYKGLAGDTSDNIPGVAGIGAKTATELLKQWGSLENLYAHLPDVKTSLRKKLELHKKEAFLSKKLGAIDKNAPVTLDPTACVSRDFDQATVVRLFQRLGFFSLIQRLPQTTGAASPSDTPLQNPAVSVGKTKSITSAAALEKFLGKTERVAVFLEHSPGPPFDAVITRVHLAIAREEEAVIAWTQATKVFLAPFFENADQKKIVYDGKALLHALGREDITPRGIMFDVLLAAYLLNAGGNVELDRLVLEECGAEALSPPAVNLFLLHEVYEKRLDEVSETQTPKKTLRRVFETIEMPLIPILFNMERNGILLNREIFHVLSDELTQELVKIKKAAYILAGREFNLNSPKQLSEILFHELRIPAQNIKRTKTGISTASTELMKLKEYPIVAKIESYRELFKLKTTYLDALPLLVAQDGRLHTTFQQAVAATGRLSSVNPNLQNIPARHAWNERVRGAFEAASGYRLVGADYSQIELRVMAHLSDDPALALAFRRGEDVHTTTASVVYKVSPKDVTPDMRRQAKVFNFGIMYGMGAFGLAQAAQIEQKAAAEFIAVYFKKFSGVAKFIESLKENARAKGYVETEIGRRRYTPEITSDNLQVARAAERMAINMPIQGLAADIMKLAMLTCDTIARSYGEDARMVLQVHDELIFEVAKDRAGVFALAIKEAMEHVYPLRVPLEVKLAVGKNWGEI